MCSQAARTITSLSAGAIPLAWADMTHWNLGTTRAREPGWGNG